MLTSLGKYLLTQTAQGPWGIKFGIARSLLAAGSLLTLLLSIKDRLFVSTDQGGPERSCDGISGISLYCLSSFNATVTIAVSICVLAWVVSGFLPALSAIPHAWIAFSLAQGISIPEGGDQIAQLIAILIMPVAITDRRIWHWQTPPQRRRLPEVRLLAWSCVWAVWLQAVAIYAHAGLSKFSVQEWVEGSAIYYWANSPSFGASGWRLDLMNWLFASDIITAALTWGAIVVELSLALAIFYPARVKRYFLLLGLAFHFSIVLVMGLVSFFFPMAALLVIYLSGLHREPRTPRDIKGMARGRLGSFRSQRSSAPIVTTGANARRSN